MGHLFRLAGLVGNRLAAGSRASGAARSTGQPAGNPGDGRIRDCLRLLSGEVLWESVAATRVGFHHLQLRGCHAAV